MATETLQVAFEHTTGFVQVNLSGGVVDHGNDRTPSSSEQWQRAFVDLEDAVQRSGVQIAIIDARNVRRCDTTSLQWLHAWLQRNRSYHVQLHFDGRVDWHRSGLASLQYSAPNCLAFDYGVCAHSRVETREDHYFASSGNGSIVTVTYCVDCGEEIERQSERFD